MLVEVERSGLVEAVHRLSVAAVGADGRLLLAAGDQERPFYMRSLAKPFQAAVSRRLGAALAPEELAVACASHDGSPVHVAIVVKVLARGGLSESDLLCPPAWPLSEAAERRLVASGERAPRRIWHNCSGKHAAMLLATRAQGWDTRTYLEPTHPLQEAVAAEMGEAIGPEAFPAGVDGCGVPSFRGTVHSVARAFRRLVEEPAYAEVATAMHRYPALVSGDGNDDSVAALWLNAVAKRGAEGGLALAMPGVGAVAIKVWDGARRAVAPALLAVLDRLGWPSPSTRPRLAAALEAPVLGAGRRVGTVRARPPWPSDDTATG